MNSKQECGYEGPDLESVPRYISELVKGMKAQLPAHVTVELSRIPIKQDDDASLPFDLKDYAATYVSDDRGLVQVVYHEEEDSFNVRITGELTQGIRERVMGYDKTKLETLLTPEQSMSQGPEITRYPWLIEGQRRNSDPS